MSQVFPHHNLILKTNYFINWFFKSNYACLRPFPNIFWFKKTVDIVIGFFKIKIRWGKTWYMHKHAFQGLKRMFIHVLGLSPPYFDKKIKYFINWFFFIKIWLGKIWDVNKRSFQALKRTVMHLSGLPLSFFDKKPIYKLIGFFSSKNGWGRLEKCIKVRLRAWNARLCMSHIFTPTYFDFKKQLIK